MRSPRPIRNVDAGDLIEFTLVVAVTTVIVIRFVLELSGYPKLAGGGLHIAHVLYGGIMMIAALLLLFTFLNMSARWAAAFVGGVGFGFFIDEVGKFISNDVNYFFKPAVAVMYVVFMVLFLALYAVRRSRLKPHDALANALSLLREERDGGLDAETRRQAPGAAGRRRPGRPAGARSCASASSGCRCGSGASSRPTTAGATRLAEWYRGVAARRWFSWIILTVMIMAVYCLSLLGTLLTAAADTGVDNDPQRLAHWVQAASSGVTALLIIIGFVVRRRSRGPELPLVQGGGPGLAPRDPGVRLLQRAVRRALGRGLDLLLYAGLTYMIGREEARERDDATASAVASATPASALAQR